MGRDVLTTDVFVAGGGPAGLATAIALRKRGLRVMVADFARPPIDKTCGEGLMPQTVSALRDFGVTLGPAQAVPFRGIRFIGGMNVATGEFPGSYGMEVDGPLCTEPLFRAPRSWVCNASGERA